jgi:hypothetical protein
MVLAERWTVFFIVATHLPWWIWGEPGLEQCRKFRWSHRIVPALLPGISNPWPINIVLAGAVSRWSRSLPQKARKWSHSGFMPLANTALSLCCGKMFLNRVRPRSVGLISRLKNTVGWFVVREKYCFDWKNKLKKTNYKAGEQALRTRAQRFSRFIYY